MRYLLDDFDDEESDDDYYPDDGNDEPTNDEPKKVHHYKKQHKKVHHYPRNDKKQPKCYYDDEGNNTHERRTNYKYKSHHFSFGFNREGFRVHYTFTMKWEHNESDLGPYLATVTKHGKNNYKLRALIHQLRTRIGVHNYGFKFTNFSTTTTTTTSSSNDRDDVFFNWDDLPNDDDELRFTTDNETPATVELHYNEMGMQRPDDSPTSTTVHGGSSSSSGNNEAPTPLTSRQAAKAMLHKLILRTTPRPTGRWNRTLQEQDLTPINIHLKFTPQTRLRWLCQGREKDDCAL